MSLESFVEEARRIVGPRWVLVEPWSLAGYAIDYWPLLVYRALRDPQGALSRGPAAAVLPGSEEEVAALLEAARRSRVRLAVYAGGSGVLGGAVPDEGWVVLDVARLDWVDWFDEEAGIVDAGAGAPLAEVEGWLNRRGWTLRHYPQSLPEARLGGLVATRSTGQYSTGYGGVEERVKGLHAAVPGVGLVRVKPSPRRSVLIPIEQLFTGSEGLLGVITRVYLEALPLPECELRIHWRPGSFLEALREARILAQRRLAPDLYRIYDEQEAPIALGVEGPAAIGVYEGPCRVARARLEAAASLIGSRIEVEEGEGPASRWLRERFNVIASIARLLEMGLAFDTIEFSAPWGSAARVYEAARSAALSVDGVAYVGVHASHFYPSGVALYMTFAFDAGRLEEVYGAVWDRVMRAVSSAGGSISHHHGVGRMRLPYLRLELGEEGVRLVARIKRALDPQGILRGFPL